jgi:hypothetical protein
MLIDRQSLFSDAQAITATAFSTNVIDLLKTGRVYGTTANLKRDIGRSTHIPLLIQVVEAFNTLTSLQVEIQCCALEDFSAGVKTVDVSPAAALALLQPGYRFLPDHLPRGLDERYVRLRYVVTGTNPTTGRITAAIVAGAQTNA